MTAFLIPWTLVQCGDLSYADPAAIKWPDGVKFPVPYADGAARFEVERHWPWDMVSSVRGLAISEANAGIYVHGVLSLCKPTQIGCAIEGNVRIGGRKYYAFTSSLMFEIEGKLVNVAELYVCGWEPPISAAPTVTSLETNHG